MQKKGLEKNWGILVLKTAASAGIKMRLNGLSGRVGSHQNSMGNMKNALERVAGLYEEAEKSISGYADENIKSAETKKSESGSSFWDDIMGFMKGVIDTVGTAVGGIFSHITTSWGNMWRDSIGKVLENIRDILGNGIVVDTPPHVGWLPAFSGVLGNIWHPTSPGPTTGTESGNTPPSGTVGGQVTASGAPRYNQPDYTQRDLAPDASGIYGPFVYHRDGTLGRVCEWNIEGQQLSCTYYTLRKLNERGLSYACKGGPGNGNQWYANFDHESGLPNYGGNNALMDLANNLTLPQENIVVSFESGSAIVLDDGRTIVPGHVLLIDEIYRDGNGIVKVKYSDMFYNEPGMGTKYITSLNGSNPQVEKTLEDFMSGYNKSNGNISGAVVVGAGS